MKKCPACDWQNTDDAIICWNCRRHLSNNEDYALRAFLFENQKLFAIMGVFLVIALFFNNISLLNFSTTSTNPIQDSNIQTSCNFQYIEQNSLENTVVTDNSTVKISNISNRSSLILYENAISGINCTTNVTSVDNGKTQNQLITEQQVKFFSFLSMILFLVTSIVVLWDAFSFIRIYDHAKNKDQKRATIEVLKDTTIFLFIIPFVYLLVFFLTLTANGFGQFFPLGVLITTISVYVAEIIVVMYLVLRYLNSLKGDRTKEYKLVGICLLIGIVSGLIFWLFLPDSFIYTSTISLAFILMAIITFFRPYIER